MPDSDADGSQLVIGVDGGGSHVLTLLADAATGEVLGRGEAGPANLQAVGVASALRELDLSVERVFASAGRTRTRVAAACLGLAGVDWENGLDVVHEWAGRIALSRELSVANDATLLLAAGTPDGWGLAVIAGTGSIAFVRTRDGQESRAGGWGYLLGDEGSAFQITLAALRAVCRAVDGTLPPTPLVERFLERMRLPSPASIIDGVYRGDWDRAALAALAPMVLEAAEQGDELARAVVARQANDLALTAATPVRRAGLLHAELPVALAGGLLLRSAAYRERFLENLKSQGVNVSTVQLVAEPAVGAVTLARRSVRLRG